MALLNALQYGVVGLSAIMLILAWRIIQAEQRRPTARASVFRYTVLFMAFAVLLAGANIYLQISQPEGAAATQRERCLGAIGALRSSVSAKMLYEVRSPRPDPSLLEQMVKTLQKQTEEAQAACGARSDAA